MNNHIGPYTHEEIEAMDGSVGGGSATILKLAAVAPALAGAVTAGDPPRRVVRRVVVHHSATATGNVSAFRRYHVEVLGWEDVGYHYVILPSGVVEAGRPLEKAGAHARGRNADSIGICLVGTDTFTVAQRAALVRLIVDLDERYGSVGLAIEGHHEKCPGPGLDLAGVRATVAALEAGVRP